MVKNHSDREREETRCRHYMDYCFRLAARVLIYASSHRQDNTYHDLCYTSRGALARTRNSPFMLRWLIRMISHGRLIELFIDPASASRLVYKRLWCVLSRLWDGSYKIILVANKKE